MERDPTLAEILADDTGSIRAEVADLLMERRAPHAPRAHAARQVRLRQRPIGTGWLVLALIVMLVWIAISDLTNPKTSHVDLTQSSQMELPEPVIEQNVAVQPIEKRGRVIADNVHIRIQPNLNAEIIGKTNQDEILRVISFKDGWYEIALPNQRKGYIFGAYLLPQDFDSEPYQVAITKDNQTKLLVHKGDDPLYFEVLWPDGRRSMVLKDDVDIYK